MAIQRHGKGDARQPEIIRASQMDEKYSRHLTENISNILRTISNNVWLKYNHFWAPASQLLYHGLAGARNLQTLGEEYTEIIQLNNDYSRLPSKIVYFLAIILENFGEALMLRAFKIMEQRLQQSTELYAEEKETMTKIIRLAEASIPYIKAFHKSVFYLNGRRYQISKRLTSINYVLWQHWLKNNQQLYGYKILGMVSIAQCVVSFVSTVMSGSFYNLKRQPVPSDDEASQHATGTGEKCILCLETRKNTVVTVCGHLFCWGCIAEWLQAKNECPVCRDVLKMSASVPLQNYG